MKVNCYDCRYRGTIPVDRHSKCRHPEVMKTGISDNYFTALGEMLSSKCRPAKIELGIIGGGPAWPLNFNPAFLRACRGFKSKLDGKDPAL